MLISVIIRTYNEEKYLSELLQSINAQKTDICDVEIVIVDSGSTDKTLAIAKEFDCRLTHITKEEFTFGGSLNIGCAYASGEFLVFISGHCIPVSNNWIENIVKPLIENNVVYSYGRQIGRDTTKYSETQVFDKYFPATSAIPQEGFYCNNANAAIRRDVWQNYLFDEELTGLEDMALAQKLVENGYKVGYVANAIVYHIHDESWPQLSHRYEREAIALQHIYPNIHINFFDFLRYVLIGLANDYSKALHDRKFLKHFLQILMFRVCQYWGSYKGNHITRKISKNARERYFYPK